MGLEIERKFLIIGDSWRNLAKGILYRQGYIPAIGGTTVRVRTAGEKGFLTLKSMTVGLTRDEYEYEIPLKDACEMLSLFCGGRYIEKHRYKITAGNFIWEIDEFHGANSGLILAEIELTSEDCQFEKPAWIGREVTTDFRYRNSNLLNHPFSLWGKDCSPHSK
ncbi:MAG: CYTH domain-containing protein [Candidatus Riflebacteria bacterium]|nr:CYTH domain-containing protein [Candidatus Riflebacteria bacterium]